MPMVHSAMGPSTLATVTIYVLSEQAREILAFDIEGRRTGSLSLARFVRAPKSNGRRNGKDPVDWEALASTIADAVRFLDDVVRHGTRELVAVNHWNKLLKGSLVRHLLATQLTGPDGLEEFAHPQGYVYRPDLTESSGKGTTISFVATR